MGIATRAIYADDPSSPPRAIEPPMQVAANYRYHRDPVSQLTDSSRIHQLTPTSTHVTLPQLSPLRDKVHVILALLTPKCIFIGEGYHGVHRSIKPQHQVAGVEKLTLEDLDQLGHGDLLHIKTPLNPTGEARNLGYYVAKARQAGAYISVDATLAPPQLKDPLQFGVDIVMHSGTRYIGCHSDMPCGVLVMGSIVGSFESWLGILSLRTLHLRVVKQSQTAEKFVSRLHEEVQKPGSLVVRMIDKVQHAFLQESDLKDGWVASVWMNKEKHARRFPSRLYILQHAASLGGVESLIEWRAMSDEGRDTRLTQVSCGVGDAEDMKSDMLKTFESLLWDFPQARYIN
ncbi:hypothetical protein CEP52_001520 [Fusarium oligoseptatum]|uniref:Cystathionine beta-lyase n=1 Tax=Fusarium oligoseptatum TaxID=2604345 RepID=A0A428UI68_9HYPO|nr:hypothetical protein CEP52_001520 [Fusarium oligoseptatum]